MHSTASAANEQQQATTKRAPRGFRRRAARLRRAATAFGASATMAATLGVAGIAGQAALHAQPASAATTYVNAAFSPTGGGWQVSAQGAVSAFGGEQTYGSMAGTPLTKPVVAMASTPDGKGYWLVASDGGIFAFGDATFYGSMGGKPLTKPVVGIAATTDGHGYWEVASDGGIFAFGDAAFYGSMGNRPLNAPVVGMAANPGGRGYWEVASDGGMFSFGAAQFRGSMGGQQLAAPVVGVASTPDGQGYWQVAADGGVFAYGDATFYGSLGGQALSAPIIGIAPITSGGYALIGADGSYHLMSPGSSSSGSSGSSVTTPTGNGTSFSHSVSAAAVSGMTAQYDSTFINQYTTNYGAVGVNTGINIMRVGAGQPLVTVASAPGCGDFQANTGQVPIPPDAANVVGESSDSPLVVYQASTDTEWELWEAHMVNGVWQACWGGRLDNYSTSSDVFPYPYGMSGSGISYLATTVTEADIASGSIDHTFGIDVTSCTAPEVAPANRTDCGAAAGAPEGTIFRLPASLAMPAGLTPFGQMVFRALQNYGMVVEDQSGAVMVQAENTQDWALEGGTGTDPITASWSGLPEWEALQGIPWASLQVVAPS